MNDPPWLTVDMLIPTLAFVISYLFFLKKINIIIGIILVVRISLNVRITFITYHRIVVDYWVIVFPAFLLCLVVATDFVLALSALASPLSSSS